MNKSSLEKRSSLWPNRFAWLIAAVTFPLIWVGGLVTTYDAGMAVPDWPGTYGYNMFSYPLSTWWSGPWDLFIEHGHRLLGSLAGLLAIGLVVTSFRTKTPSWFRILAIAALLLVIGQGALGGIRVLAVDRFVAKVHGCVGPAFFAFAVGLAVASSKWWRGEVGRPESGAKSGFSLSISCLLLAYLQLVLGANLRHIAVDADPMIFRTIVVLHVVFAFLVLFHAIGLAIRLRGNRAEYEAVGTPALFLVGIVSVQIMLGLGTWIVKYGFAGWLDDFAFASGYLIEPKSMMYSNTITAHVATGSLILAFSTFISTRIARVSLAHKFAAKSQLTSEGAA